MSRKPRLPAGPLAALLCLALAGVLFTLFFEITPRPLSTSYSSRAQENQLLALSRWLEAEGKTVLDRRPLPIKALETNAADCYIVDARSLDAEGAMLAVLLAQAEGGSRLILHSIVGETGGYPSPAEEASDEETSDEELFVEEASDMEPEYLAPDSLDAANINQLEALGLVFKAGKATVPASRELLSSGDYGTDDTVLFLDSDLGTSLEAGHQASRVWLDGAGIPRMAELPVGKGHLVVTGKPIFMHNLFLSIDKNARLAWDILSDAENILIMRGEPPRPALFGTLFERGNPAFFLAAFLALVIAGFWMQLAPFGRSIPDTQDERASPWARWIYEGRFLKKYGALDSLLEPWRRQILLRSGLSHPGPAQLDKLAHTAAIPPAAVADLFGGRPTTNMRRFRQHMHTINALLETL